MEFSESFSWTIKKEPEFDTRNPAIVSDALLYAPASFIRHGAVIDSLDLDARGGYT